MKPQLLNVTNKLVHINRMLVSSPRGWGCFRHTFGSGRWSMVFPTRVGVFLEQYCSQILNRIYENFKREWFRNNQIAATVFKKPGRSGNTYNRYERLGGIADMPDNTLAVYTRHAPCPL